jgi:hypothetical protein
MKKLYKYIFIIGSLIIGFSLGSSNNIVAESPCGQCEEFSNPSGGIDEYCDFTIPQVYSFGCSGNNGWICFEHPFCGG